MKKRIYSLALVLFLILGLFAPSQAVEGLSTEGVLRVGMEANYAPFNWTQSNDANGAVPIANSDGEYANGYDVYIAKELAKKLDLELEIIKTEWDGLPPALLSGAVDVIIAGMSPTEERKQQIDFSHRYYLSDLVIVLEKDSEYMEAKSLEDFQGAKLAGQMNTFHYDVLDQMENLTEKKEMQDFPVMISATITGDIDGYVSERPGAMAAVSSNPNLDYVIFDEGQGFDTSEEDTSIAVGIRKNSPLTEKINQALSEISEDERNAAMEQMVELNVAEEQTGFWQTIKDLLSIYGNLFFRGALSTMGIAIFSTIVGFIIGIIVAVIRSIKVDKERSAFKYYLQRIANFLLVVYIEIFRGTPMMIQSLLIYYGSRLFFDIEMSAIVAALFIVSINTGAYLSEVVRGGINSIDKGQYEAFRSIGMSHTQGMRHIILPQAIKNILPTIGNEFVINIKDTSVLNVIAVTELFFISRSVAGSTYLIFQSYLIAAGIYFILTFTTTRILLYIESRFSDKETVFKSSSGGAFGE